MARPQGTGGLLLAHGWMESGSRRLQCPYLVGEARSWGLCWITDREHHRSYCLLQGPGELPELASHRLGEQFLTQLGMGSQVC